MTELSLFLKQVASRPQEVVALAPSSRALARRMAEAVPEGPGSIVELGAGTGKITAALLDAGVPVEAIHSFEINPVFCDHLKRQHPRLRVYRDRAENFGRHGIEDIKAVVSGLPLLSMDKGIQRRIVGDAFEHLRPGGAFIQFTYGPVPPVKKIVRDELSLGWTRSETIWGNVPPATSYSFYRRRAA
ncbi:MAG: methyltransferase domain-containing protein [Albidovulum sp.]|nr:methyltransferase domain-containing protein [Albidovulum sp.]